LPEAQLDRFIMHVKVDYPDADREVDILRLVRQEKSLAAQTQNQSSPDDRIQLETLFAAREQVLALHMSDDIENYIVRLVTQTRTAHSLSEEMGGWIAYGASPRGTISLDACARASAWLAGRDYVSPDDVQSVLHDVLRHRVLLSYEAEADDVSADHVIDQLLNHVAVP